MDMKKWSVFLSVYLCLCLLAACGASGAGAPSVSSGDQQGGSAEPAGKDSAPSSAWPVTTVCRIVDGAENGELLLAERDGGNIYKLNAADVYQITINGGSGSAEELGDGMLVDVVHDGMILETWPAQFANVKALCPAVEDDSYDVDDRCALYLRVLEDLWETDAGLNSDAPAYVGVDLSQTSLSGSEQAAVAWAFAQRHGAEAVQGTYDELVEQGYITGEPLDGTDARFWQWEDGILFSITEKNEPVVLNLPNMTEGADSDMDQFNAGGSVTFDAQKWRSSLGAYLFCDCVAVQDSTGHWGDYTVGAELIS